MLRVISLIIESVDDVDGDERRGGVPCDCCKPSDAFDVDDVAGEGTWMMWRSDNCGDGNDEEVVDPGGDTDGAEFGYGIESDFDE